MDSLLILPFVKKSKGISGGFNPSYLMDSLLIDTTKYDFGYYTNSFNPSYLMDSLLISVSLSFAILIMDVSILLI